jgi:hypothetical protein
MLRGAFRQEEWREIRTIHDGVRPQLPKPCDVLGIIGPLKYEPILVAFEDRVISGVYNYVP